MMKKGVLNGKRTVVIASLVLVLGLVVYLNWYVNHQTGDTTVTDVLTGSTLGQAMYVNGDASSVTQQQEDYFSKAKADRADTRKKAMEQLDEVIEDVKVDNQSKSHATQLKNQMAKTMETESNMETLIKAKGFEECVVVLSDQTASVVVRSNGLTAAQTVQIQEIVQGQSGISLENIKIIEVK